MSQTKRCDWSHGIAEQTAVDHRESDCYDGFHVVVYAIVAALLDADVALLQMRSRPS